MGSISGATWAQGGRQVGPRTVRPGKRRAFGTPFRNLEGFLTDVGPSWSRHGAPKASFSGKNRSKNGKNEVQEPSQKKRQTIMANRCRKWRFWEGKIIEILRTVTKIQGFGVLQKHTENDAKMATKIDKNRSKMGPWAPKRRFLELWGRFWDASEMRCFLNRSLAAQKSIKIAPWSVRGRIFRFGVLRHGTRPGIRRLRAPCGRPIINKKSMN